MLAFLKKEGNSPTVWAIALAQASLSAERIN
jgi:hypothetical protein